MRPRDLRPSLATAFWLIAALALPAWAEVSGAAEAARVRVIQEAMPAVVKIQGTPTYAGGEDAVWGSGFFYSSGRVVTNFHVVDGLKNLTVTLYDGRSYPADVFAVDRGIDLAILEVHGATAPATLTFARETQVLAGQTAIVLGSPFGKRNLVSVGVISGSGPFDFVGQLGEGDVGIEIPEIFYTDARVEPGNSGGPLLDGQGRVIGVIDAVLGGASGIGGLGIAVPGYLVVQSIYDLEQFGVPQRGWLGAALVDLTELDPLTLRLAGLESTQGAMVDRVQPGSPAEAAGLQGARRDRYGKLVELGDVIVAVGGKAVKNRFDVIREIARRRPGEKVELTLWRNGQKITVTVQLTARR
ncbi:MULTISPECIES: S1C family serine protease [Oceanithermus]|uniref:Serine protease n=2 Tax=Oceanithermus desulfurans TaxID=227924 RepID=A0A511RKQ5_9DEIN|nr:MULTISPECIES: S1C family serine protease [Oceanithermus]MBB6028724.1 S1-C subfamily serine protease [Oceanithermus desulfurans]GEM90233.1 serine protease [Oceanithermus desulfurans NBRC 100063]